MKTFEPRTTVPGAQRVNDPTSGPFTPVPLYDKKGRPVWDMPTDKRLQRTVRHFRSHALRRAYERGEVSHAEATHEVTIHRGMTMRVWNKLRGEIKSSRRASKQAKSVPLATGAA